MGATSPRKSHFPFFFFSFRFLLFLLASYPLFSKRLWIKTVLRLLAVHFVSFTKSNLSLQKTFYCVQPKAAWNIPIVQYSSFFFSLFNTVRNARLAHAGLLRKLGFLPAESRFWNLKWIPRVRLLCRHSDGMPGLRRGRAWGFEGFNRQRLVSRQQQQQDFCGFVREKGIVAGVSLVVLSVGF